MEVGGGRADRSVLFCPPCFPRQHLALFCLHQSALFAYQTYFHIFLFVTGYAKSNSVHKGQCLSNINFL